MTSSKAFTWPGASKKGRRTFTAGFKRDLVEQTLAPGASISGIALANGINANQLFAWRKKLLAHPVTISPAVLLPVHLKTPSHDTGQSTARSKAAPVPGPVPAQDQCTGHIEMTRHQTTVRVHGQVDPDSLRIVLQCLAP